MTLKERILGWFKKKKLIDKIFKKISQSSDDNTYDNLDQEEWNNSSGVYTYIDKDAVEGKVVEPNLEDLISEFNADVPGKKAIWGGKETIAFKKWKAENNWD